MDERVENEIRRAMRAIRLPQSNNDICALFVYVPLWVQVKSNEYRYTLYGIKKEITDQDATVDVDVDVDVDSLLQQDVVRGAMSDLMATLRSIIGTEIALPPHQGKFYVMDIKPVDEVRRASWGGPTKWTMTNDGQNEFEWVVG